MKIIRHQHIRIECGLICTVDLRNSTKDICHSILETRAHELTSAIALLLQEGVGLEGVVIKYEHEVDKLLNPDGAVGKFVVAAMKSTTNDAAEASIKPRE